MLAPANKPSRPTQLDFVMKDLGQPTKDSLTGFVHNLHGDLEPGVDVLIGTLNKELSIFIPGHKNKKEVLVVFKRDEYGKGVARIFTRDSISTLCVPVGSKSVQVSLAVERKHNLADLKLPFDCSAQDLRAKV